jgi:cytochrome c oxidase assembly protein subunit 15
MFFQSPWWLNFLENRATIQFDHRMMAYLLVAAVIVLMILGRRAAARLRVRIGLVALCCALLVQIILGVMTVLLGVPVPVAAAHQAVGFVLLGASVFVVHQLRAERE